MDTNITAGVKFSTQMTPEQKSRALREAEHHNKKINEGNGSPAKGMGKDSFLKLLVTQLKHQNPTKPMEDKQFIAQMAQFSSLEQMSNVNKEMKSLLKSSQSAEANTLLGKKIEGLSAITKKPVSGTVNSVLHKGDSITLKVGNEEVLLKDIHSVK